MLYTETDFHGGQKTEHHSHNSPPPSDLVNKVKSSQRDSTAWQRLPSHGHRSSLRLYLFVHQNTNILVRENTTNDGCEERIHHLKLYVNDKLGFRTLDGVFYPLGAWERVGISVRAEGRYTSRVVELSTTAQDESYESLRNYIPSPPGGKGTLSTGSV